MPTTASRGGFDGPRARIWRFCRLKALIGSAISLTALIGLVVPAGATTVTDSEVGDPLAVTPASMVNVDTGEVIAIPAASPEQLVAVPQTGVPLGINQGIPDLGPGPASVGGCWTYTARYIIRNGFNQAMYETYERWDWCSSDGSRVTSLPYHLADVYPRNGFVNYGWRSWSNGATGQSTLTTTSQCNVYYSYAGARYNYYPMIEATLYPDGTIVGWFYSG